MEDDSGARVQQILTEVRALAVEYYEITGKPLGVTGEVAEFVAAKALNLDLATARTAGHDALRKTPNGVQRIQIKGRAVKRNSNRSQRVGTIKRGAACDSVLLVLLDQATLEPLEMWEASYPAVEERLAVPGSKSRDRGALGVAEFKKLAHKVWPDAV